MNFGRSGRATIAVAMLILMLGSGQLSLCTTAFAQGSDGRLIVTVKDPAGAVIPNATITATNQQTQSQLTGTTTDAGLFTFSQVPVGTYTVTVSASNFGTKAAEGVNVDVGKDYDLVVELAPGISGETVTVTAGEDLVTTSNAAVTNTVTHEQVQELPLDGRDPLELIQLQAGVSLDNGRGGVAINGQRAAGTTITQDGITIQDYAIRESALEFSPNRTVVSQVAEFTVTTQNAGSDVAGSSAIQLVTPSGSSDLHGEVYEFHRNDALGANDFFNNFNGIERPQLIRNQFGFAVGGPVYIPKVYEGKDKLFFFGSYEGFRERTAVPFTTTVFTPAARAGFFTYRTAGTGPLRTVNVLGIKHVGIDPTIANLLTQVPLPNSTLSGDLLNTAGFSFNKSAPTNRNQGAVRLDYQLNDRHHFEAVYQYTGEINGRADADLSFNIQPVVSSLTKTHFGVAAWTWNITNTLTNELRAGLNNSTGDFIDEAPNDLGYFVVFPLTTDPQVAFDPQGRRTIVSSLIDNASYVKGAHFIRFGTRIDRIRLRNHLSFNLTPRVNIGLNTAAPASVQLRASDFPAPITAAELSDANNLLASLAGYISQATREYNVPGGNTSAFEPVQQVRDYALNEYAIYGQDQWRIVPRLTLTAGLRWDYTTPIREQANLGLLPIGNQGQASILDPNAVFGLVDGYFYKPDRNNFAPSVGLAYDVFGDSKTVVRGGFSMAFVNDETIRATTLVTETNPGLTTTLDTGGIFGGPLTANVNGIVNGDLAAPPVILPIPLSEIHNQAPTGFVATLDPNLKTPFYKQWNVSIEREIGWDTAVAVRYVGNKGFNLISNINQNQIDVFSNGFAADVARAQQNGFLAQQRTGTFDPRFNAGIPGSQQLTVFPKLAGGGLLTNSTVRGLIEQGQAGILADVYFRFNLAGSVPFYPNPNAYYALYLGNAYTSDYNALELEARRRFSKDLAFQVNYTYSKSLTYSSGIIQQRQDFPVDINRPSIDRRRSLYDVPHNFKANVIYTLPFGEGKHFNPENRYLSGLVGSWQLTSIFNWYTGAPISIITDRGTVTTVGELADSSLTADQIKNLFGIFHRDGQIYYVNPDVIGPDGRAVAPDGQTFAGQVFFNPGPGEHGSLQGLQFSGPSIFRWDASAIKRIGFTENTNLELRFEVFNILNHPIFGFDRSLNIDDPNFGRFTKTVNSPRVIQLAAKFNF